MFKDLTSQSKSKTSARSHTDTTTIANDNNRTVIKLFDKHNVQRLIEEQNGNSSLLPRLKKILEEGPIRPLSLITQTIFDNLSDLRERFANFVDVINFCERNLHLMMLEKPAVITLQPILIVGEPGIGKTRFLSELTKALTLDFYQVDLSSTTAGFVLSGSSTTWAEGKPGIITDSLRQASSANFIMLLDEIDKASSRNQYDPLGCLYTLLESDTAKRFVDEALQFPMDCSAINWVATANDLKQVPEPIRSRFSVFQISAPNPQQIRKISLSIFKDIINQYPWGKKFEINLSDDVVDRLIQLSPREQKKVLINACGCAALRCKGVVNKPIVIQVDDIEIRNSEPVKYPIGFY